MVLVDHVWGVNVAKTVVFTGVVQKVLDKLDVESQTPVPDYASTCAAVCGIAHALGNDAAVHHVCKLLEHPDITFVNDYDSAC
jgi:hypothetical protein